MNDVPKLHATAPVGDQRAIDAVAATAESFLVPPPGAAHPLYAGAVVLVAHAGHVVVHHACGWAVRYADRSGSELPPRQRVAMATDTIFDLASISKLFTTIVVLQHTGQDGIDLDLPVAHYLPAFAVGGKSAITVRQLLTHTSGLPAVLPLWRDHATPDERLAAVLAAVPATAPGAEYVYSDPNMITAGLVAEAVGGQPLDQLVQAGITAPLGMTDTGYTPDPGLKHRIAATEVEDDPPRGLVHGEVHDENAWSLGGVAGHAGVFGTARDLATLAQAILDGGSHDGARILDQAVVEAMLADENTAFPGHAHGLGFELNQPWFMGRLSSPAAVGHTGFTGTSLVIDFASESIVILLSNRVHPSRDWGSNNPARAAVADAWAAVLAGDA